MLSDCTRKLTPARYKLDAKMRYGTALTGTSSAEVEWVFGANSSQVDKARPAQAG